MILTISNAKGGSAKTTTAVNLTGALVERGHTALLIDMDPQGTATTWLTGARAEEDHLAQVIEGTISPEDVIRSTPHGVDLMPASAALARMEKVLAVEPAGDTRLRRALRQLPETRYDYILIDTPPNPGSLSSNALVAADALIIPVEARRIGLEGIATMIARAVRLADLLERPLPIAAILACRVDRRTEQGPRTADQIEEYVENHLDGVPVFRIRENVRLATAFEHHEPITTFDGRASGAIDYRRVAERLETMLGAAARS